MRLIFIHTIGRVILSLLILLDISINRLFNGRVETISSRAGRAAASGRRWGLWLCDVLDELNPGHCERARLDPTGGLK